jgi:hypothetical protein
MLGEIPWQHKSIIPCVLTSYLEKLHIPFVQHVYVKKDMNTKKTCLVEAKQRSKSE